MVKKQITKQKKTFRVSKKNIVFIVITIVVALFVVQALNRSWQNHNTQSIPRPRWAAKSDLNDLSKVFNPTAEFIFKGIQDSACISTSNLGQPPSPCELKLQKYYRVADSLESSMRAADKILYSLGWTRNDDEERFAREIADDGGPSCSVNYSKKDAPQYSLLLMCHKADSGVIDLDDSQLGLRVDEYVFGIEASEVYDRDGTY